jgi:hypothetical protein
MSIKQYPGGIITKNPTAPSGPYETSTAPGIWTLDQVANYKKQGIWPTAGNVAIGGAFGGGYFAGQISTAGNGIADYNLVVGPVASAQSTLQWQTSPTSTSGTSSVINGPANSAAMNDASHPAAQFCEGLTIGGYSDWYMPAKNELEICYYNLKPTTTNNSTGSGTNTNAVPSRGSNYTTGTPAQTSATAFITSTGAEAFTVAYYWSSTQNGAAYAWSQTFNNGDQNGFTYKLTSFRTRAVRRVAV